MSIFETLLEGFVFGVGFSVGMSIIFIILLFITSQLTMLGVETEKVLRDEL